MSLINLLGGLAQGYEQGLGQERDRVQNEELKKLQVKMFKFQMDQTEQAKAAKKQFIDAIGQVVPHLLPDDQAGPSAPDSQIDLRSFLKTPKGQALALQAGNTLGDLKTYTQPTLLEMLSQYRNATGGGGGATDPTMRFNADGTGYLEVDPTKQGELAVHQKRLGIDTVKTAFETGMPIDGGLPAKQPSFPGVNDPGITPQQRSQLIAKRNEEKPQALASVKTAVGNFDRLEESINGLLKEPNLKYSTGLLSSIGGIPGTPQKDVTAKIETLKSQVGLNVLQSLRDASKSGGAVGQVSNYEEQLLQNNIASLDQKQGHDAFVKNLIRVLQYSHAAKQRMKDAYKNTYGEEFPQNKTIDFSDLPQ